MKTELWLKWADLALQLLGIVVGKVYIMYIENTGQGGDRDLDFLLIYFSLGTCQLLSCLINKIILPKQLKSGLRSIYEVCVVIIILISINVTVAMYTPGRDNIMLFAFAMVAIGPLMALLYLIITCSEINSIGKSAHVANSSN